MMNKRPLFLLFTVFCAIALALIIHRLYLCQFLNFYDEPSLDRFILTFDYYTKLPPNSILFLGNSQVMEGIDSYVVANHSHLPTEIFNLGIPGDDYLNRLPSVFQVINSHPHIVFLGISPSSVSSSSHLSIAFNKHIYYEYKDQNGTTKFIDRYLPSPFYFDPIGTLYFKLTHKTPSRCVWRSSSFAPSLKRMFNWGNQNEADLHYRSNFKNPFRSNSDSSVNFLTPDQITINEWSSDNTLNPRKQALMFYIEKLEQANITVIVIDMPVNPLLLEYLPNSSLPSYYSFIDHEIKPRVQFYFSYINYLNKTYFADGSHLNILGRNNFSITVANILKEMH